MCGPGVEFADGTVPGVFAWQPPPALVVACRTCSRSVRHDRAGAASQRVARRPSARPGVLAAADVHVATRLARAHRRDATNASCSPSRCSCAARGSDRSCSTSPRPPTTITPDDDDAPGDAGRAAVAGARPDWITACAASPLVAAAPGGAPVRLVGLAAVARPLLAAGGARRVRARCSARPTVRTTWTAAALQRDLDALFPRRRRRPTSRGRGRGRASRVSVIAGGPGHRQDDDDRAADHRAVAPAARAADRAGGADRQGGGPARGGRARRRRAAHRRGPDVARHADGVDDAPPARPAPRCRRAGSGTTGTTGCRYDVVSSTSARWCR